MVAGEGEKSNSPWLFSKWVFLKQTGKIINSERNQSGILWLLSHWQVWNRAGCFFLKKTNKTRTLVLEQTTGKEAETNVWKNYVFPSNLKLMQPQEWNQDHRGLREALSAKCPYSTDRKKQMIISVQGSVYSTFQNLFCTLFTLVPSTVLQK